MDLAKYETRVIDEPFKERFQWIPLPMVDEVCAHVKEMLEVVTIHPSQSTWWDAVCASAQERWRSVLLHWPFKLNSTTRKDSYPLPKRQEAIETLVGGGYFSCLDLKVFFGQIAMDKVSKPYTTFTMGNLGFLECKCMPFGLCNAPTTFQRLM